MIQPRLSKTKEGLGGGAAFASRPWTSLAKSANSGGMLLMIFANGSVPRDENGCEVDDKVPAPFDIFLIIC